MQHDDSKIIFSGRSYIFHPKEVREEVCTILRNQINGHDARVTLRHLSRITEVPLSSLHRWNQEIMKDMPEIVKSERGSAAGYTSPINCPVCPPQPSATFLPPAPAAGSPLLGQARQPPQSLQVPQVSALSMQHGLNVFDQGAPVRGTARPWPAPAADRGDADILAASDVFRASVWQKISWHTTLSSIASWCTGGLSGAPPYPPSPHMAYAAALACAPQVATSDPAGPLLKCSALI